MRIKLVVYDTMSPPPLPAEGWPGYQVARVLFRHGHATLGADDLLLRDGRLDPAELRRAGDRLLRGRLDLLARQRFGELPARDDPGPTISVTVCTRDRPGHLARCLQALQASRPAPAEIIVVDNASKGDATREVADRFGVVYVREDRPGLNWARSRGAQHARGEIVAYVDDDVVVSPDWLEPFARAFRDPGVAGLTGLVMPLSLDTASERMFEKYCGFIRGFAPRRFSLPGTPPAGAGNAGAGACMALRRDLVNDLALFRVELDAGTAARTGGDTYAFYRLIALGYAIEYVPDVVVWHQHRDSVASVVSTLRDYSVGTYVFFLHSLLRHREVDVVRAGLAWFRHHHLRQLFRRLAGRADAQPLRLTLAEIGGCLAAPLAYLRSRLAERRGARRYPAPREAGA